MIWKTYALTVATPPMPVGAFIRGWSGGTSSSVSVRGEVYE